MFAILKHFVPKKVNFPEGMRGSHRICGKSGGEGGYRFLEKMENPGRRGVLSELPSVVGVWIFSGTTQYMTTFEGLHVYSLRDFVASQGREASICFLYKEEVAYFLGQWLALVV